MLQCIIYLYITEKDVEEVLTSIRELSASPDDSLWWLPFLAALSRTGTSIINFIVVYAL